MLAREEPSGQAVVMTQDVPAWGSPPPEPTRADQQQPVLGRPRPGSGVTCPLCGGGSFREEEGKVETRWAMGHHILTMKVCQGCSHVLFFYQGGGSPF